jgi:hypothetical protein
MLLVYITKPDVIYDNDKEEFRQFGTTDGKTLLPIYVIGILFAIILYVFFHYLSLRHEITHQSTNTSNIPVIIKEDVHEYTHQIQILQNQVNQLLQQQLLNTQIQQITNSVNPNTYNII